jgi:5-methylcytosine-specific restriction endonuclease McrA
MAQVQYRAKKYDGSRCIACGRTPKHRVAIDVDPIKPRKTYPHLALDFDNLHILCEDDNHGKGDWDSTDWR